MEKKKNPLSSTVKQFDPEHIRSMMVHRMPTGIEQLDKALGGGIGPGLYLLGAIPNLGKSTLTLQIAQNLSASGNTVFFFSMEMPAARIASKAIARQIFMNHAKAGYTADMLLNEKYLSDSALWHEVEQAKAKVEEECRNLYIIERSNQIASAADIARVVEESIKQGQKPVVFVDYLQILSADTSLSYATDRAIVDANVRVLTTLATTQNIPIIVISSFNRDSYKAPVTMAAFKESGSIEYSADVILGMQLSAISRAANKSSGRGKRGEVDIDFNEEKAKNPREVELVVLKQRYGQSGNTIPLKYYPANDYFVEANEEAVEAKDLSALFPGYPERRLG